MDSLDCLHCGEGVFLDGFIEKKFAWGSDPGERFNGLTPYQEPWIGFIHNPPGVPDWFNLNKQGPRDILKTQCWRESMLCCQGLFTLSTYLKQWLRPQVPVSVCSLIIPTETPENRFSASKYLLNNEKQVVQVGWWLRRFTSIYDLRLRRLKKTLLNLGEPWTEAVRRKQLGFVGDRAKLASVQVVPYLRNEEYDELLSKNIVFLDLYDSSANNAIVECIARTTPILVNSLPAVVEYLGRGYPFYFETLEEAADKAENEALVLQTHDYLKAHPIRTKLTREHFLRSFVESEIYESLRLPLPATHCVPVPALRESPPRVNFVCTEPESSSAVQRSGEEPLVCELSQEWQRALAGDGQARANWQIVEGGGGWSWQENAICARNNGSEWSAYQYSRCDPQVLRALKNFVVEVTLSGSAQAAGVSFGPYKDFLTELDPQMGPRRVQLEVDVVGDTWAFRVDGRLADRHWWDSAVRSTADLVSGNLTFKVRGVRCALFQDLAIHTFLRSCEFSVITTCYRFAQRLRISLRNWVYQNLSSGTHEILVVNPNSPDGTHELLAAISSSYPHVRVREVPVASSLATYKGAMINRALELSRGRWIWLTDADCLFPPTCGDAVLLKIAGRTQRVFYGERRHLSAAQTNAVLSGRLDGLSQFDLLARSIPPRPAENVPWGYTQIMERATLDLVRYREDLNHFAHSDSQFIEDCKRRGIVPEQVEGLFCLQLDHPLGLYGSHTFL